MGDFIRKYAPLWIFRIIINRAYARILGWGPDRAYFTVKPLEHFKPEDISGGLSKTTTVIGTCGHTTVKIVKRPYETERDARIRCSIELEKKVERGGG